MQEINSQSIAFCQNDVLAVYTHETQRWFKMVQNGLKLS